MEQSPLVEKTHSAETIVRKVFDTDFENFAEGNPEAFRGRSVEIEGSNVGRRIVCFTETADSVTVEHIGFYQSYSRITGALKFMKDSSPVRSWRPSAQDQYGGILFALGDTQGQEATPQQIADFTPLEEALKEIHETG